MTRDVLFEAIKNWTSETDELPTIAATSQRIGYDNSTIHHKFGSWHKILKSVGLAPVPAGKRYSDEECFENIVSLWTRYGRQPSFAELNRPPSRVGSKAYVLRWGGWRSALAAFVAFINEPTKTPCASEPTAAPLQTQQTALPQSMVSRSLGLAMRYRVLVRDRFRCQICGRSPAKDLHVELHIDHIVPSSKGGQNTEENLRILCFDCNLGKGAKHEPSF